MIRTGVALAVLLTGAAAQAQPAPRVTLDVPVAAAPGFKTAPTRLPGQLTVAADGTLFVLLNEYAEPSKARVELIAFSAAGAEKMRVVLPVRSAKLTSQGFDIESLGVVVSPSGDIAAFVAGPRRATLFRLGSDGRMKKATDIPGPTATAVSHDPDAYYILRHYVATADNGVLLAGGFGSGPYAWWLGKFSLDGRRLWQGGPGRGFPESVNAVATRANGDWIVLLEEMTADGRSLTCFIDRYGADGKRRVRARIEETDCYIAAGLSEGSVIARPSGVRSIPGELVFIDDGGRTRKRVRWPFDDTDQIIVDGQGLAAIVTEKRESSGEKNVVRVDAGGVVRWKSPAAYVTEIAHTPDGQIAALVWDEKRSSVRLVRYADP